MDTNLKPSGIDISEGLMGSFVENSKLERLICKVIGICKEDGDEFKPFKDDFQIQEKYSHLKEKYEGADILKFGEDGTVQLTDYFFRVVSAFEIVKSTDYLGLVREFSEAGLSCWGAHKPNLKEIAERHGCKVVWGANGYHGGVVEKAGGTYNSLYLVVGDGKKARHIPIANELEPNYYGRAENALERVKEFFPPQKPERKLATALQIQSKEK
ncbi:hypothetical protein FACS1894186_0590 [Alphaproteobacteria bacterium]|nr:hypothetical protein FACS1894186_0590 [Alphaproteobacteria bacterium]